MSDSNFCIRINAYALANYDLYIKNYALLKKRVLMKIKLLSVFFFVVRSDKHFCSATFRICLYFNPGVVAEKSNSAVVY